MKKTLLLIIPLLFLFVSCEDKEKDCAGVEGGVASVDDCGMCTGGTTSVVANSSKDCAGVCGGGATSDDCEACEAIDGTFDCEGTCNGSAVVDCEGVCGGGGDEDCCEFNYSELETCSGDENLTKK
jgi:hypothetical protein